MACGQGDSKEKNMNASVSRRNFLLGSAATAGLMGLAACGTSTGAGTSTSTSSLPSADKYPIDPDGDDVTAKWTSEETRDGWTKVTQDGGATLGVMDASKIIQVDGYAFKDMNGDGKLDFYEDWRQPVADRAASLAALLTADEALQLMWHGGTSDNSEGATDPDYGLVTKGSRAGVSRLQSDLDSYASDISWINTVQQMCEESTYGIPYLNSTDQYQLYDIPDNVCLSASMDKDVWRKAGMYLGRAWRATGVRCLLGPQVDVYSQIIGCRLSGSVCEDPAVNRDFTKAFAGGLQSTWGDDDATDDKGWGTDSVAAMLKHYVGEGCSEGGRNDHSQTGEYNVFPGDNFDAHLIPFLDGGLNLDSTTGQMAAVMPCYGIAYSEDEKYGENVGSGYNKRNLGILRNAGWDGMFTTDWGILTSQTYGVADLTEPERYQKMIEAGIDQYGGGFDMEVGDDAYKLMQSELGDDKALARVQESARHIIAVMMNVSLFEQPYSDRSSAKDVLEDEAAAEFGLEASEKSTVMLKNSGKAIAKGGVSGKPKAYIAQKLVTGSFMSTDPAHFEMAIDEDAAKELFTVVTDIVGEPTGTSTNAFTGETTTGVYQASDAAMPSDEDLAGCEWAIVRIKNPQDAKDGVTGGSGFGGVDLTTVEYLPITLQYEPYTATTARDPSIAGEILADGTKENRSYKGKSSAATNLSDLELVKTVREKCPNAKVVAIVEAGRPMVFSELEPYCDVILMSFAFMGTPSSKAYANIIGGKAEPSAVLPFQMPINMETVEASYEDVPRDVTPYTDSEGNTYDFCFGLNWSGVIDDDRVSTYSAKALTEPDTEITPGDWKE